jgi:hypothetical protein
MIFIFLREVNQIKFKFTPDYNRYKWMAQNIFSFVGQYRRLKLARMWGRKAHLNSIIDPWIPFKQT